LIGHGGIESFTMPEAGMDSLLAYGFTAMIAHFLMSLGQTLFHRYLGHSRIGGRFFTNHIQFHYTHYSGDHVVSRVRPDYPGLAQHACGGEESGLATKPSVK
jgi:hypothetical protein